jgi:nitroreductase
MVSDVSNLADRPLADDQVGLLAGLTSTRSIRRYTDDPVPEDALRDMLFAATRAPSGSNRQPFRFLIFRDGEVAARAKALIGTAARAMWREKRQTDGYDRNASTDDFGAARTPKQRMADSMQAYVDNFERCPVLVLPCLIRYREPGPFEGSSVYPACQNLLLAARALGYGGVLTGFHGAVDSELRELCRIPEGVAISATITIGRPAGRHGAVRRRPLRELVYADRWDASPDWAVDPPGTTYTQAGPPKQ